MPLIATGDIKTYYEIAGEGSTLVFVHGAAGSHDNWHPQVKHFSNRYSVITYDLRGHGKSTGSDRKYSCALFADDLHALLTALEVEHPVIGGLSLGGMVCQEYAVKYQSNLAGLVLADTAVASALTWSDKLQKWMFPSNLVKWYVRRKSPEDYAKWSFGYFDMKEDVREYLIQEQLRMDQGEFLKLIDAIYGFDLLDLATIKVPTLVVLGENERKAAFPHAEKMFELIEDSKKVLIPDAGHASNLENPGEFNRVLDEFLEHVF
ncbi:MAG: alpha/beta hydrolase [Candidatus Thorarchaeota archaeon]|nr:MAG: alpha/beta hydrolase [Candidatus Thorarchaeota archaeon]